jgi:hypothetical protein
MFIQSHFLKLFSFVCLLPLAGLAPLSGQMSGQMSGQPPNIVFILSDDHRADFMGVAGDPYIQTPRLDSLAGEGMRFTNAFAVSATCAPSRAAFWTGRGRMFRFDAGRLKIHVEKCGHELLAAAALDVRTGRISLAG